MPELPEVETVARQLAPFLRGRQVRRFRIHDSLLRVGRIPAVRGREIVDVTRSGKRVLIEMSKRPGSGPLWLAVHLRMTGRLLYEEEGSGPVDHLRATFVLDRGRLLFADTRRFGTFHWHGNAEEAKPEGVEPLSDALTPAVYAKLLGKSSTPLKPWLLRQDKLVGLGNIYASEILHAAKLSPFRPAGSLDRKEVKRLHGATRRILERAIRACGTTFSDFQDARGVEGSFQQYLAVYDRDGRPCRRCRTPIERVVQQQRSTYYCPRCAAG
jgi:formamidopyrimidine-DNA glycosylase